MLPKHLAIILCLVVAIGTLGCASRPSLEELEAEAMETGDWSAVEQRQKMDRKQQRFDPDQQCPDGQALLCSNKGELEMCECVSLNDIRAQ